MRFKKIAVAVPMMDELENVSRLLSLFEKQSFRDFELYVPPIVGYARTMPLVFRCLPNLLCHCMSLTVRRQDWAGLPVNMGWDGQGRFCLNTSWPSRGSRLS